MNTVNVFLSKHGLDNDLVVVRSSSRAKRLIFKSSLKKGVEIIVPNGADPLWVAKKTEDRLPWIKTALTGLRKKRKQLHPTRIHLKATGENWSIEYVNQTQLTTDLKPSEDRLLKVCKNPTDVYYVPRVLQSWIQKQARASLFPWLDSLAKDRELHFNRIYVRNQVSRWGSCSEKRNISLNQNLLFLSRQLVEYVLHHELTHLDHMNHSPIFWSTLGDIVPNCMKLRDEIKVLDPENIPMWASPGIVPRVLG